MAGIAPEDVTAVIITRGDLPELMFERQQQFARLGMPWAIVESRDIYTRYTSAEKLTATRAVYFQDDDVRLADEDILAILAHYKPGVLVSNMYDEWIVGMGYEDLAMVGLGAVCDVGLWREPFARFVAAYGSDDHLKWDADFIFGVLAPFERYDFNAAAAILPEASNDNRLWRTPGQHERKYESINMARKLRTLTGAVMAKNEEEHIARAIKSIAPMVSSVTLLDTGSTDLTIECAEQACIDGGIEFHLIEAPFENMAVSRNVLLDEARKHGDYMLMFDADEEWLGNKELPPLALDVFIVNYAGPVSYGHPRIIRSTFPCRFEGQIHASLTWDEDARGMVIPDLAIVHHGDLTHGDYAKRLRRDVELLSDDINNSRDVPHNTFMRAKAYEGLSEWELARRDYEARLAFEDEPLEGIPAEQRFYAAYRLGVLLVEKFGQFADGADLLMTAWLNRPQRIESIRMLARYLNAVADATPIPESDILFVHRDEYKSDPKEG